MVTKSNIPRDFQRSQKYKAIHKDDDRYGGSDSECSLAEFRGKHIKCLDCPFPECKLKMSLE